MFFVGVMVILSGGWLTGVLILMVGTLVATVAHLLHQAQENPGYKRFRLFQEVEGEDDEDPESDPSHGRSRSWC